PASEGQTRNSARGNANAKRPSLGGPAVEAFGPFSKSVSAQVNGSELVIECNAMPEHGMMVGIRAWQQQVPLPQPFEGDNAWRLPLNPKPASRPISVLKDPLRGAIALAVNGVPIFCALNNRSEDTFLAGELDKWGGHCGRGDDYHYHIAPTHLEDQVGIGNPIAFALDGYPILGRADRDGTIPNDLDPFNGHTHDGHYHYHATDTFPYVNGGLHGEVKMSGDQIQQPRDSPMRPGQPPLRGAKITNFERDGDRFDLTYEVSGREAHIKYELLDNERAKFMYVSTTGDTSTEVYQRGSRGRGGPDRGGEGRGPRDRRRGPFGWIGLGVFSFFALGLYAWRNKRIVGHASHDT
ncbi:MAG: YHYH protein, partial [Planctomycetota bacterium]